MGDSCEVCGWTAAVLAMLAFGSFGVPIKSNASRSVDIDPLVFQSYKTLMCFVTSWLVLLLGTLGEILFLREADKLLIVSSCCHRTRLLLHTMGYCLRFLLGTRWCCYGLRH
jgi:hypothetical protein